MACLTRAVASPVSPLPPSSPLLSSERARSDPARPRVSHPDPAARRSDSRRRHASPARISRGGLISAREAEDGPPSRLDSGRSGAARTGDPPDPCHPCSFLLPLVCRRSHFVSQPCRPRACDDEMQRGSEMRPVHNSVDTVNAAAAAIVSAGSRTQPTVEPRRKWADWLSVYFCFGSQKNDRRISHAVLAPEPASQRIDAPAPAIPDHPTPQVFPFIAPPSSPASFLQSGSASIVQSPMGPPSFSPRSPNSPSPTGPPSIFAIGPYAHETQVVSPPIFSAFTTEPSTAPFTPPPESVHLTTPSSPEVPYAKLLTSINNSKNGERGELHSYHMYPESPIGRLISPSSICSGTSSPFPDPESQASSGSTFPSFPVRQTPKILDGEGIATQKLIPRHMRNGGSLLDGHISAAVPVVDFSARLQNNDHAMDHRVSFELTVEDVARCLEKKTAISGESAASSFHLSSNNTGGHSRESNETRAGLYVDETYHDLPEKARRSLSLRLAKEFKFSNVDAPQAEETGALGSDWWANEKVAAITTEPRKSWSFRPIAQPGAS